MVSVLTHPDLFPQGKGVGSKSTYNGKPIPGWENFAPLRKKDSEQENRDRVR
jgi:hypothetical protein